MDVLNSFAKDIPIIEDCAHASGTAYKGRPAGSMGVAGCFSFHAVKNISMGEGGALVTDRDDFNRRARRLRWLGIDRETWDRTKIDRSYWWEYQVEEAGTNCHMDDIHAAIGLVQLQKLEAANRRRREIAEKYSAGFEDIQEVSLPPMETDDLRSSWHMYRIEAENRNELNLYLENKGIFTGVHYKPLHLYSCYGRQSSLPVAEKVFTRILTLPMHTELTDDHVSEVIDSIRSFYHG
jgi:perosamine synthetase